MGKQYELDKTDQSIADFVTSQSDGHADRVQVQAGLETLGAAGQYDISSQNTTPLEDVINGAISEPEDPDTTLQNFVPRSETPRQRKLQNQIDTQGIETDRNVADQSVDDLKAREKLRQEGLSQDQLRAQSLQTANVNLQRRVISTAGNVVNRVASLPTPGSVALLVMVLLLLQCVLVDADGKGNSRAKLLWLMLTGRVHMTQRATVVKGSQGGTRPEDGFNDSGNKSGVSLPGQSKLGNLPIVGPNDSLVNPDWNTADSANNELLKLGLLGNGNIAGTNPGDIADLTGIVSSTTNLKLAIGTHNNGDVITNMVVLGQSINKLNVSQYNAHYTTLYNALHVKKNGNVHGASGNFGAPPVKLATPTQTPQPKPMVVQISSARSFRSLD